MRFIKIQGTGNDFILFDAQDGAEPDRLAHEAPRLCDRRFGIGSDGILVVGPSATADFRMTMFNPDGSEGMCGNGLRCAAKYLYDHGRTRAAELRIETVGGIVAAGLSVENDRVTRVRVNMGPPRLKRGEIPMLGNPEEEARHVVVEAAHQTFEATCVSMGNPHCVIFVHDVESIPLELWGRAIENHPEFPERTNVEFAQVLSPTEIRVRVWERGAGATLACGTGACATVAAGHVTGRCDRGATVHMPGGDLWVEWAEGGSSPRKWALPRQAGPGECARQRAICLPGSRHGDIYLSGPAVTVFTGEVEV